MRRLPKVAELTVTACFNWAAKEGNLAASPVEGVEKPAPTSRESCLEPGQWEKLLAACDGPFRDLLLFLRLTGCRPMEARNLEARHVVGESIVFPRVESKGRKRQRIIPLNAQVLAIVRRLKLKTPDGPIFRNGDGAEWSKNALVCRFKRLRKVLGFEVTTYSLRHFFITEAIKAGLDPITLSRMVTGRTVQNAGRRCECKPGQTELEFRVPDEFRKPRRYGPEPRSETARAFSCRRDRLLGFGL